MIEQRADLGSPGNPNPRPRQRQKTLAMLRSAKGIAPGALSAALTGAAFLFCMGVFLTGLSSAAFTLACYGAIVGGYTGLLGGPGLGVVRWAALGACVMTGVTLSLAVLLLDSDRFRGLIGPSTIYYLLLSGVCIGVLARLGWQSGRSR